MAGSKYIKTARKLQTACKKLFGVKLLLDQRQWYHKDKDTAITVYTLYRVVDADDTKRSKIKLFQTYSQIQLVLFLRDFWYELNGWEVPTDNEVWEEIKRRYGEKEEPTDKVPDSSSSEQTGRTTDSNRTAIRDELYTAWERNRSSEDNSRPAEKNV